MNWLHRPVFQMLGGAAIAVVLLLPVFIIGQQTNQLAIARLELELARSRAASPPAQAVSTPPVQPPVSPAPPIAAAPWPDTSQIARAIGALNQRIDGLASQTETPRGSPAVARVDSARDSPPPQIPPVSPRVAATPPTAQSLADVKVRIEYSPRCTAMTVAVVNQLIRLGADPEVVEGRPTDLLVARAVYPDEKRLDAATQIAEALRDITPVEVVADSTGRPVNAIRLHLVNTENCGRTPAP